MTSYRLTPNEHVGPLTITGQSSLSSLWSWASVYFAPCTGRHMIVEPIEVILKARSCGITGHRGGCQLCAPENPGMPKICPVD